MRFSIFIMMWKLSSCRFSSTSCCCCCLLLRLFTALYGSEERDEEGKALWIKNLALNERMEMRSWRMRNVKYDNRDNLKILLHHIIHHFTVESTQTSEQRTSEKYFLHIVVGIMWKTMGKLQKFFSYSLSFFYYFHSLYLCFKVLKGKR